MKLQSHKYYLAHNTHWQFCPIKNRNHQVIATRKSIGWVSPKMLNFFLIFPITLSTWILTFAICLGLFNLYSRELWFSSGKFWHFKGGTVSTQCVTNVKSSVSQYQIVRNKINKKQTVFSDVFITSSTTPTCWNITYTALGCNSN